jgi:hypothetical protein
MWILDPIPSQTADVTPCHVATAVGVVSHNGAMINHLLDDKDVVLAHSHHPRGRRSVWEPEPSSG